MKNHTIGDGKDSIDRIDNPYKVDITPVDTKENIFYCLSMFAYPSGTGMHMGHVENYTATDVLARFKRMSGFKVINPIGWDAFGLPTENYAMSVGKSAYQVTEDNIANFRGQARAMNWSHDWDREINTSSPEYYKRTQRLFEKLLENGLISKENSLVNRCNSCKTVLANDQVVGGECERCGTIVTQKEHPQWFVKITKYADRLIKDLDELDWPEETKKRQIERIGRTEGVEVDFFTNNKKVVSVFTDKLNSIADAKAIVLAPENTVIDDILTKKYSNKIQEYKKKSSLKTIFERVRGNNNIEGEFTGVYVNHPLTGKKIPIWVSDYVLPDYANGSTLLIPSDENTKDKIFAEKYGLTKDVSEYKEDNNISTSYHRTINEMRSNNQYRDKVIYKLRDWSISRQRYWGSPIPIYYDENKEPQLIPEEELPVQLPLDIENYILTGKSPLEGHDGFKYYEKDGGKYNREYDTLDTFVCSSFYFLRYVDPTNTEKIIDEKLAEKAFPIDFYIGGKEHTTGHLLYSRFIYKFLYDLGYTTTKEPFRKLVHQGVVYGTDGKRMSKRRGNGVDPSDLIKKYPSDSLRMWILFMGPIQQDKSRTEAGLTPMTKFLNKISRLGEKIETGYLEDKTLIEKLNDGITDISKEIESLKFNTAISKIMGLVKLFNSQEKVSKESFEKILLLLAPFAPETSSVEWAKIGNTTNIHYEQYPKSKEKISEMNLDLPVQINGKTKGLISIENGWAEDEILKKVMSMEQYSKHFPGGIKRVIYVKNKIINIIG